jgi:hypothetical protein
MRRLLPIAALVTFAVCLCGISSAAQPPSLGSAASFAVLGGSAVNAGSSTITGNLGVSPGKTITGSPVVKLGAIFRDDALARQAQKDSAGAYSDLASRTCTPAASTTLGPGVYCLSTLTGTLTLDAGGDPHAVWIFQAPATLTTAADSSVRVIDGGYEGNVFWQVGDSAIVGERTALVGTVLARNNITLGDGASLSGRALAQTGTVNLNGNNVSLCCEPITLAPATLADGKVGVQYTPVTIAASGGTPPYTYAFSGSLPPGLTGATLSGTPTKAGSYSFTVTATDSLGCTGSQDYRIVICGTIVIDPPELSKSCAATRQSITASGGTAPYRFRVAEGTLPGGVSLSSGGDLTGAAAPGCFTFIVEATDALGCTGRRTYTICTIAIAPATLPSGSAGAPYPTTTIMAIGGTAPYTYSAPPETLPPGLVLSTGELSSTPTTAGCFTFTVTVTDALGFTCSRTYTVCIGSCPITIAPPLFPDGCIGAPYSQTMTPAGGTAPYRCSLKGGTLPPGLSIAGCTLAGTPTTPGCYTFTETVTDAAGISCSRTYTICIDICVLPKACVGQPYSAPLTALGTGPYTISLASGSGPLPPGLNPSSDGLLVGEPTSAGRFDFTLLVTSAGLSFTRTYTVCSAAIELSPATLPAATAGVFYMQEIVASGGTAPYEFAYTGMLPRNLELKKKDDKTVVISGIPIMSGLTMSMVIGDTFTVIAKDANGCIGKRTYTIPVICPTITISPPTLPGGNVGTLYSEAITATGGTAPHTFTVASGAPPPGLTLTSGGTLSGTPTTTGIYCFAVTVTDDAGCSGGPVDYAIVISAALCPAGTTITLSPSTLPAATTGAPYAQLITAGGGTAPYTFSVTSGTLPPGLTLSAAGLVSGIPTTGGTYVLAITATDANGCVGTMGCSISMNVDIPALSWWGMVLLSILLTAVGVVASRKGSV